MFHGTAAFAGRIHAATGGGNDHGLALGQAFGAVGGVLEGAARLGNAVNPGLQLGGNAEVVERGANHHHVGRQKLADQSLGHGVLALLHFAQAIGLAGAGCHRVHGEVGWGIGHQVQVAHLGARVVGLVSGHDLRGELARNGMGTGDGGINVKQLHEDLRKFVREPPHVAMGSIVDRYRFVDKPAKLR